EELGSQALDLTYNPPRSRQHGFRLVNGRSAELEPAPHSDSPMLIVCPSCATSYRVETACFGEAGRLVRCVRCGDVWLGTESLLVPSTTVAENEQAEIGAGSVPECDGELSTPESSPGMEGSPEEADTFEPVAATGELHGDGSDDGVEITPEFSEFAPQERPAASMSLLVGPAPPGGMRPPSRRRSRPPHSTLHPKRMSCASRRARG